MRILQIVQKEQFRGAELFAATLSNELLSLGHAVEMIALFTGDADLPFRGTLHRLDLAANRRFVDLGGWRRLATVVRDFNPDIVQANAGDTLKYAVFSKFFFGWKHPLVFRNANTISEFLDSKAKRCFNRFLVRHTDHVISVSDLCRLDFIRTFRYPACRIETARVGIDAVPILETPDDLRVISQRGPVLLSVGSLVKEKNHTGLLRMFSTVVTRIPNAQLVIVGRGPLLPDLVDLSRQLRLDAHVHFLGYRRDVHALMQGSRALLMPSLIEGTPSVLIEAHYCRTPVVAYDVGGVSEVVASQKTGWLVEKDDEDGFVFSVLDVLQGDQGQAKAITENAHAQAIQQFDNRDIAQRFLHLYRHIVGAQGTERAVQQPLTTR